jgi:hypothetical protein
LSDRFIGFLFSSRAFIPLAGCPSLLITAGGYRTVSGGTRCAPAGKQFFGLAGDAEPAGQQDFCRRVYLLPAPVIAISIVAQIR